MTFAQSKIRRHFVQVRHFVQMVKQIVHNALCVQFAVAGGHGFFYMNSLRQFFAVGDDKRVGLGLSFLCVQIVQRLAEQFFYVVVTGKTAAPHVQIRVPQVHAVMKQQGKRQLEAFPLRQEPFGEQVWLAHFERQHTGNVVGRFGNERGNGRASQGFCHVRAQAQYDARNAQFAQFKAQDVLQLFFCLDCRKRKRHAGHRV